jgi:hypothetical protein
MPGSANFTPYSPPLDAAASVFVVARYSDGETSVLPNVKCLSIHYSEGAVPPTAQFEYVLDDTDPDSPFPISFEEIWPLDATGPYVVQADDELVVVEYPEDGDPILCFHGFAQIPQADMEPGGQRVTFVASGVAVRLWDSVIGGGVFRPTCDPQTGTPVATELPAWFNPGGRPNCSPSGEDGHDVDEGEASAHPVFIQDDTDAGEQGQVKWTLGKFVRYLCWVHNPDETYVKNPVAPQGTLDDFFKAITPKGGGQYFDVSDASTYEAEPIEIRSVDVTGRCWVEAMAEQLHRYGFELFFNLTVDGGGNVEDRIVIYRKDGLDGVAPLPLRHPPAGGDLLRESPGFDALALARDAHGAANEWTVETAPAQYEVSIVLAPGFEIAATDADSPADYDRAKVEAEGVDAATRKKYRYWTADEAGLGHWDHATSAWVSGATSFLPGSPLSLDDVLGKPDNGAPRYVARPRPGTDTLLSTDDLGRPRRATLEISTDYAGKAPALSDGTGTWRNVGSTTWKLDAVGLGVWIASNADNPDDWKLPRNDGTVAKGDVVRVVKSQASPDATWKRFYLRLTTVIEGDRGIAATAKKRPAAPSRFAIRRRVDAKDHFKLQTVCKSSRFNDADVPADFLVRDDTADAKAHAEAMRSAHEMPATAGQVRIPWISHSYGVGDWIAGVDGLGIDLNLAAGGPAGESPKYPFVVGVSYNCQNPQATTLVLSDHRAEPDRGYDPERRRSKARLR